MAGLLNVGEMDALALHVLVELAMLREEDSDARKTAQDMAEKLHASVHTLQKVARRLIMLGLVEGTRGASGGLRLLRNPEEITMLQVLEGVEGKRCSNGCLFARRVCPAASACMFEGVTGIMEKKVRDYFAGATLAELRDAAVQPA